MWQSTKLVGQTSKLVGQTPNANCIGNSARDSTPAPPHWTPHDPLPAPPTATIHEDYCGIEPVRHPEEQTETRPPPEVDEDIVSSLYNDINAAVLGGEGGGRGRRCEPLRLTWTWTSQTLKPSAWLHSVVVTLSPFV